jgi:hypothetical protein
MSNAMIIDVNLHFRSQVTVMAQCTKYSCCKHCFPTLTFFFDLNRFSWYISVSAFAKLPMHARAQVNNANGGNANDDGALLQGVRL